MLATMNALVVDTRPPQQRDSWLMRPGARRLRRAKLLGLLASIFWLGMTGCEATPIGPVRSISRLSQEYYKAADLHHRRFKSGIVGEARQHHGGEMLSHLQAGLKTTVASDGSDYANPLLRTVLAGEYLKGDVVADYDTAHQLCRASVDPEAGSPLWIPGYILLAKRCRVLAPPDVDQGRAYLADAEDALTDLEELLAELQINDPPGDLFERDALLDDPSLSDKQKLRYLFRWLRAFERWDDPEFLVQQEFAGGAKKSALGESFIRRARATVCYERTMIEKAMGRAAGDLAPMLQEAVDYDVNFVPAQLEMAEIQRRNGNFKAAESWLRGFVESPRPHLIYGNDARVWGELAMIYGEWYEREPSVELIDLAEAAFAKFHELAESSLYPSIYLGWARFSLASLQRRSDLDSVSANELSVRARDCIETASDLGAPKPATERALQFLASTHGTTNATDG